MVNETQIFIYGAVKLLRERLNELMSISREYELFSDDKNFMRYAQNIFELVHVESREIFKLLEAKTNE